MGLWLYFAAAATAYLVGSLNPAIMISRAAYRSDVRSHGSRNPGFTNFHRVFGSDRSWAVFLIDFSKSALLCALFGWLFGRTVGMYHLGAAFTSLFTLLGHAYPVWHEFRGGKGVSVMFAAIWFVEYRAGLVILVVFLILMAATRYMSLSVLCAAATAPVTILIVGSEHVAVPIIITACVLFMIWRHRENINRLLHGTESRFSFHPKSAEPGKDPKKE